jgi:hypothetical protein
MLLFIQNILNSAQKVSNLVLYNHTSLLLQQAIVDSRLSHQIKMTVYPWPRAVAVSQNTSLGL